MNVSVLGTGGTIASTDSETGAVPTERGTELVERVPALREYGDISVEQVAQVPSYEMTAETLELVGERVAELDDDSGTDAIVVTHGTDTMAETAYFLDATRRPTTPVLLTGAQRRPDERSSDGPANLVTAFAAARAFADGGHGGTFVAFDGAVHSARYATKVHTSALDAFSSPGVGPVATHDREGVRILRRPRSETEHIPDASLDPTVFVVGSGAGADERLAAAALDAGADGLVVNGTGLGNVTASLGEFVESTVRNGTPVVVASRCVAGRTTPVYGGAGGGETLRNAGAMFAGDLPAHKARLKLALALSTYSGEKDGCEESDGRTGSDGDDESDEHEKLRALFDG
ncbi:asparaginase [Haladaptatus sp. T7]|uniref:asparaginase n=1 Tax=Haladaptatus sp. T7 TaxID=2029368 RepID=UPI0021A2521D|nr:asparaginase [Haladaptatus sp. T7]GKZ15569.1 L-asparaginase [Haladaptatus sp. T7]